MELPESYLHCARKMASAAVLWLAANRGRSPALHLPPEGVMLCADLNQAIELLARNDAAKELLLCLERASQGEGTAYQACVILRSLGLLVTEWSASELREAMGVQFRELQ